MYLAPQSTPGDALEEAPIGTGAPNLEGILLRSESIDAFSATERLLSEEPLQMLLRVLQSYGVLPEHRPRDSGFGEEDERFKTALSGSGM